MRSPTRAAGPRSASARPSTISWPQAARMSRPRLLRTDTVIALVGEDPCETVHARVRLAVEGDARRGVERDQVDLALDARQQRASRRASSGVSFTPASSTYSKVMRPRRPSGNVRHASMNCSASTSSFGGTMHVALRLGRGVQRDRQVRHQRFAARASRACRHQADRRERDPARRPPRDPGGRPACASAFIVCVVVVQRLAHAHQHDVEGRVEQVEFPARARGPGRRSPPPSGGGRVPSCRSGRSAAHGAADLGRDAEGLAGVSGMKTASMCRPSARRSTNFVVPSSETSALHESARHDGLAGQPGPQRGRQVGHGLEIGDVLLVDPRNTWRA
jgi:hypothetical protein